MAVFIDSIKFSNYLIKMIAYAFLSVMMLLSVFTNVVSFTGTILPLSYMVANSFILKNKKYISF